jgi:uncharacterized cupin superfamily protein
MANLYSPDFDADQDRADFAFRRAKLGWQAGCERLGLSLFELEPGRSPFPYHWHAGNEELLVVVHGQPDLRTPEGWRTLEEGEVVSFPAGEHGAHQLVNRSGAPARVLIASEMREPDVLVYPDSGKVAARERAPGAREAGLWQVFRSDDQVDYWEGERAPE